MIIKKKKNSTSTYREGDDERIPPPERRGILIYINGFVKRKIYGNNSKISIIYMIISLQKSEKRKNEEMSAKRSDGYATSIGEVSFPSVPDS
jgi:hypothetical protein